MRTNRFHPILNCGAALTLASAACVANAQAPVSPSLADAITRAMVGAAAERTPAQVVYGLPTNPYQSAPVSLDLTRPLSLRQAIDYGLARRNTISIAQSGVLAARERLTQARSSYYPQVTPSISYQNSLNPGTRFNSNGLGGGTTVSGSFRSDSTTSIVAARQLIYDSGRREANVGFSRRSEFASEYALGNERQSVVLAVAQDYYNLLRTRELVRVQEENVRRATTTRDVIQAQAQAGTTAQSDVIQAEADLANARVALLQSQSDVGVAQATLRNSMGVVNSQPLVLADTPAAPPATSTVTENLDAFVRQAYQNRLDVRQQQENVNAEGYSVRLARINAGLSVSVDVAEGYALNPNAGEERSLNVSASFPLFDGGASRAAVRQSQAGLDQARRTLDQIEQDVRLNVEQSFLIRAQARERYAASILAVAAAQTGYDVAIEKQRNQLVSIPEVVNAEVQLVNARVSEVQAIYDYYVADAALQRAIGANDPTFRVNVPAEKPSRQTGRGAGGRP